MEKQSHWESIYSRKQPHELSWTQDYPRASLDFIHQARLGPEAHIIDIGGGDSRLVDCLIQEGFRNVTVLDISAAALARARARLGEGATLVKWVVSDILEFQPEEVYDFWHDRATFHFLLTEAEVRSYVNRARAATRDGGAMAIGTFSKEGPQKCSGLEVRQYSEEALTECLDGGFQKIKCITEDHRTPFGTTQNFLFCSFRRRGLAAA